MTPVESDFPKRILYLEEMIPNGGRTVQAYKQAVQTMAGKKKVIIRTLDIGADKQVEYFNLGKEEIRRLGTVQSGFV